MIAGGKNEMTEPSDEKRAPARPFRRARFAVAAIAAAIGMTLVSFARAEEPQTQPPVIQSDPALQAAIRTLARPQNESEFRTALETLRQLGGPNHQSLIPQLLLYAARSDNTRDAMIFGVVVRELRISDRSLAEALIPLLDAPDELIGREVRNILGGIEDRSADRPPDFSIYRQLIADDLRRNADSPAPLIQYMYEADAGRALQTLVRAFGLRDPERIKPILLAEHTVADALWKQQFGFIEPGRAEPAAIAEMDKLSHHDLWWVRLYVANIASRHPEFSSAPINERLQRDPNALVRLALPDSQQADPAPNQR